MITIYKNVAEFKGSALAIDDLKQAYPVADLAEEVHAIHYCTEPPRYVVIYEDRQERHYTEQELEEAREFLGDEFEEPAVNLPFPTEALANLEAALPGYIEALDPEVDEEEQIQEIASLVDAAKNDVTGGASPYKLVGWSVKADRAVRILTGNASAEDEAIIAIEARERQLGETVDELVAKQKAKADVLSGVVAFLDGQESKLVKDANRKIKRSELRAILGGLSEAFQAFLAAQQS